MNKQKRNKQLSRIALYIVYLVLIAFFIFPFIIVLSLSFKSLQELYAMPPTLIPNAISLDNYRAVIVRTNVDKTMLNSLFITVNSVLFTILIAVPAAYAFSRMKFRASKALQFITLVFQMVSPVIVIIPLYRYFARFNLLDNYGTLIALYVALNAPIALWYIKGYMDTIPESLDEAACIDGCGRLKTVTHILLPVITPSVISVAMLIAIYCWAQFLVPFILLESSVKFPISVALVNLQTTAESIQTHYLAAACIMGILPPIILFLTAQRFILSALTSGAVKG